MALSQMYNNHQMSNIPQVKFVVKTVKILQISNLWNIKFQYKAKKKH